MNILGSILIEMKKDNLAKGGGQVLDNPTLQEVLKEAQSIPMWIMAILVVCLVLLQAILFAALANKFSAKTKVLTREERISAIRTGVISAIGPAVGIFIIAVGLISRIGAPVTFMRVGVIGSAGYELMAAQFGAQGYGVQLGGPGYNYQAMTNAVWTMALGGCGWLIFTALFTKSLGKLQVKVASSDPKLFGVIGTTASLGAFSYLVGQQVRGGGGPMTALIASGITMMIVQKVTERPSLRWLREWGLGISMVVGMFVATILFG